MYPGSFRVAADFVLQVLAVQDLPDRSEVDAVGPIFCLERATSRRIRTLSSVSNSAYEGGLLSHILWMFRIVFLSAVGLPCLSFFCEDFRVFLHLFLKAVFVSNVNYPEPSVLQFSSNILVGLLLFCG